MDFPSVLLCCGRVLPSYCTIFYVAKQLRLYDTYRAKSGGISTYYSECLLAVIIVIVALLSFALFLQFRYYLLLNRLPTPILSGEYQSGPVGS
jgi:hypothetical protein